MYLLTIRQFFSGDMQLGFLIAPPSIVKNILFEWLNGIVDLPKYSLKITCIVLKFGLIKCTFLLVGILTFNDPTSFY